MDAAYHRLTFLRYERKRDRQRRTEERIHVHEEKERKAKEVQLFFTLEVQVRPPMLHEHRGQPPKWLQEAVRVEWPRRVCCVRRLGLYLNLGATWELNSPSPARIPFTDYVNTCLIVNTYHVHHTHALGSRQHRKTRVKHNRRVDYIGTTSSPRTAPRRPDCWRHSRSSSICSCNEQPYVA